MNGLQELICLTQLYLLQEKKPQERIVCSAESYGFYKDFAIKLRSIQRTQPPLPPKPQAAPLLEAQQYAPKVLPSENKAPITKEVVKTEQPKPEIKKYEPVPIPQAFSFQLQPVESTIPTFRNEDFRQLFEQQLPNYQLVEDIPSDDQAKSISRRWQQKNREAVITVVLSDPSEQMRKFLHDLSNALRFKISPLACITSQQFETESKHLLQSPVFKFLISTPHLLDSMPELQQYCTISKDGKKYFGPARLILLKGCERYFREPLQKKRLWQMLCAELGL